MSVTNWMSNLIGSSSVSPFCTTTALGASKKPFSGRAAGDRYSPRPACSVDGCLASYAASCLGREGMVQKHALQSRTSTAYRQIETILECQRQYGTEIVRHRSQGGKMRSLVLSFSAGAASKGCSVILSTQNRKRRRPSSPILSAGGCAELPAPTAQTAASCSHRVFCSSSPDQQTSAADTSIR